MTDSGPASFDDRRDFVAVEFPQNAETDRRVTDVDTGIVDDIESPIGRAVAPRAAAEQAFRAGVVAVFGIAWRGLAVAHPLADVADEVVDADLVRLELADRRGVREPVAASGGLA